MSPCAPAIPRLLVVFWLATLGLAPATAQAQNRPNVHTRAETSDAAKAWGGKVEWARLKSGDQFWKRHSDSDVDLLEFFRNHTSLNIEPVWHSADPENLAELCAYPFIFTNRIDRLPSAASRANLAEYVRRGGFLLIDACINPNINPDPDPFFANHSRILEQMLPGLRIAPLPAEHEVFTIYFRMGNRPPHTHEGHHWRRYPLYGLYLGDRLVGILSFSGLQCGWARITTQENAVECMQMMTNLYLYAITR